MDCDTAEASTNVSKDSSGRWINTSLMTSDEADINLRDS